MNNMYNRTKSLIGEQALDKIKQSCVCVFGLGGVGSYVVEGLVRAGIGKLIIFDFAKVDVTNINRQIIALNSTLGQFKTEIVKNRAKDINGSIEIITNEVFVDDTNIDRLLCDLKIDYIIDAIDSVKSKITIIKYAKEHNINIISSMGTGNKLNPFIFKVSDISKTSVCPLARKIRKKLKEIHINKVDVLYSMELPKKIINDENVPASISFVPSVAGMLLCGYVINKIIEI